MLFTRQYYDELSNTFFVLFKGMENGALMGAEKKANRFVYTRVRVQEMIAVG